MKTGNKVKQQVNVPNWIKKNRDFSIACLRGLIDTEGCIATHTYKVNGKEYRYKKLIFANKSLPLVNFVISQLISLGFNPKVTGKLLETKHVWLYNYRQVQEYLEKVGTNNSKIALQGR